MALLPTHTVECVSPDGYSSPGSCFGSLADCERHVEIRTMVEWEGLAPGTTWRVVPLTAEAVAEMYPNG